MLAEYLTLAASRPWSWGTDDCCLFVADWVRLRTGVDGAAPWRGRYRTELGCARLLNRKGGLLVLVSRGAEAAGLKQGEPAPGAVGVLEALTRQGPGLVAGICVGRRWAVRAPAGLLFQSVTPVAVWRV